jgi:hypothetical protein
MGQRRHQVLADLEGTMNGIDEYLSRAALNDASGGVAGVTTQQRVSADGR